MTRVEHVVGALVRRGELWTTLPGTIGLRGAALSRLREVERDVRSQCIGTASEWMVPPAISLATLERARYFESFPQWLTVASHLSDDPAALERLARSGAPSRDVAGATGAPEAALPPAVCYHVYEALAGRRLARTEIVTAQGTCWRHEGDRLSPLARGWAFTMREVVCVGSEADCAEFAERGITMITALADSLALPWSLEVAEDPFFAPTARGRALLQRIKSLKRELRLPVGDATTIAAASVNQHERFFGEAFDITLPDGSPAWTACVAFGLERWLLAVLCNESAGIELPSHPIEAVATELHHHMGATT